MTLIADLPPVSRAAPAVHSSRKRAPRIRLAWPHLTIGRKLAGVIGLLSLLTLGVALLSVVQIASEQRRAAEVEEIWTVAFQAQNLARSIEHAVVAANAVYTAKDKAAAKQKLEGLEGALAEVEAAREPFFAALGERLEPMRRLRLQNQVNEFIAYQKDTAELGLTISPQAALLQAQEEPTVRSREQMVKAIEALGAETLTGLNEAKARVASERQEAQVALVVIPIVGLLLALAAAVSVTVGQIQRPLARLKTYMTALAANNLTVDVPFTGRRDEIGEMANAIAVFRTALTDKAAADARLQAQAAAEHARLEQLSEAARRFEADALGMMQAVRGATERMGEAASAMSVASDETEKDAVVVADAAAASARAVDSIAEHATQLSQAANGIGERIRSTSEMAATALDETRQTGDAADGLVRAVSQIGAVIDMIGAIAGQTNLLALNASIEAARAGDMGRGFAVVAQEVKALAQQTANATAEVTQQIEAIQQASRATAQAVNGIGATIERMTGLAAEVAAAAHQQEMSVRDIAHGMSEAAGGSQTVSRRIESVRSSVVSQGTHFDQVQSLAGQLDQQARTLGDSVDRFLVCVRAA
ncbi:methyl-accepting chemotaxis protein [Aquabacter cavernae]|uniref:methyl-accepting chemotaxis protein n=1 Tax=Aquabacter cavernae TaxID=2496029 RepID=UPI000F8CC206|nr:methyl-accepting chemotaxis protein [Aquabacter cavernae]